MLDLPQANVSQHLMILREAGLVVTHKTGKTIFYQLTHKNIFKACLLIRDFLVATRKNTNDEVELGTLKNSISEFLPIAHDPVCQMRVSSRESHFHLTYQKQNYYFCASGCLKKFKLDPAKYIQKEQS